MVLVVTVRRSSWAAAGASSALVTLVLVAPLLWLIARRVRRGEWKDHDVSVHSERGAFLRQALLVLPVGSLLLAYLEPGMRRGVAAAWILLGAVLVANRFLKVSLHTVFAAFCGILTARSPLGFVAAACLVGGVAWSRVALRRHTLAEVIVGGILGLGAALAVRAR